MAAVCGSSGIASLFSQAAFAAESDIADGKIVRFDFAGLQSMAQALAKKPWGGAPGPLPDTLANLTPQPITAFSMTRRIHSGTVLPTGSSIFSFST
ncbi:glucan biosynthesis protein D [Salmonella enterica subsp. enterica]|uniref:Glucan biosynthesis protein D n=1 Tax=Salmonella enterica I TaxID=59201 RepID=A0A379W9S9_SALET|nr:glucan biosynthesis protein D [Salmonella enterica subsp. enterica]